MIVKFKTRKDRGIYSSKSLVRYVLDKEKSDALFDETTYLQNLDYIEPETLHKSFTNNFTYQTKRKGSIALMHTILSISKKDFDLVTTSMLNDLRDQYIKLRGLENAVLLSKVHKSENWHIHFLISGNEYKSKKRLRMSKAQMKKLLRDFEMYQVEKYPQLKNSIVHLNKKEREKLNIVEEEKNNRKEKYYQVRKRYEKEGKGRITEKEKLKSILEKILATSKGLEDLVSKIKGDENITLYKYRGKLKGVLSKSSKRKYRFTTLGIEKERLNNLNKIQDRLEQLKLIKETFRRKETGRGRG